MASQRMISRRRVRLALLIATALLLVAIPLSLRDREPEEAPRTAGVSSSSTPVDGAATDPLLGEKSPSEELPAPVEIATFELQRIARGTAIDAGSGEPVPGAAVELHAGAAAIAAPIAETVTGPGGEFEITAPHTRGSHRGSVRVRKDGYLPWSSGPLPDLAVDLTPRLVPATPLEGRVVEADGAPIAAGWVVTRLTPEALAALGGEGATYQRGMATPLGPDGSFATAVTGDSVRFTIAGPVRPPFETDWIPLPHAGVLTIALPPRDAVELVVTDEEGAPIEGAEFSSGGNGLGSTDREGRGWIEMAGAVLPAVEVRHFEYESVAIGPLHPGSGAIAVTLRPARWLLFEAISVEGRSLDNPLLRLRIGETEVATFAEGRRRRTLPVPTGALAGELILPGHEPLPVSWPPGSGSCDLGSLVFHRGTGLLIRVLDPEGSPVEGASIWIRESGDARANRRLELPPRPETSETGTFRIGALPATALDVHVQRAGLLSRKEEVRTVEGSEIELVVALARGGRLRGVLLGVEGAPLSAATIATSPLGDFARTNGLDRPGCAVDADGAFELAGIPTGFPIELRSWCAGRPETSTTLEPFVEGEVRTLAEPIVVALGGRIAGRVLDGAGDPIEKARVSLVAADPGGSHRTEWSRSDGEFEFPALLSGRYRIHAEAAGFRREGAEVAGRWIEVAEGGETGIELILDRGLVHRARAMSPHGPLADAVATIAPDVYVAGRAAADGSSFDMELPRSIAEARSDEDGWLELGGLPEGPLVLTVSCGMHKSLRFAAASAAELPAVIEFPAGGHLEVEIETEPSDPLPDFIRYRIDSVQMSSAPGAALAPEDFAAGGRERRGGLNGGVSVRDGVADLGLLPAGRWELVVDSDRHEPTAAIPIEIGPRPVERISVRLILRAEYEMSVTVTDRRGAPVPRAVVEVGGDGPECRGRTDDRGELRLRGRGIPRSIEVRAEGYVPFRDEDPDRLPGRIAAALEPAARLRIEVRRADGAPFSGFAALHPVPSDVKSVRSHGIRGGVAVVEDLPAGTYLIEIRTDGDRVTKTVTARAGEETKVEMTVP